MLCLNMHLDTCEKMPTFTYNDLHEARGMLLSKWECVCTQPACMLVSVRAPLKVIHPVITKKTDKSLLKHLR